MRKATVANPELIEDASGNQRTVNNLFMNVFTFTLREVPKAVNHLLQKSSYALDEINLFVFHQVNAFMLEHLRKKTKIPEEKFYIAMNHCGNTVSSTVPIAMKHALRDGRIGSLTTITASPASPQRTISRSTQQMQGRSAPSPFVQLPLQDVRPSRLATLPVPA
jgi:3-oxoacyl-[acyl-carrier-protein] synthase-3